MICPVPWFYALAVLALAEGARRATEVSAKGPLRPEGYRLCVVYLKLFEKLYAPLTAGLLAPFPGDTQLSPEKTTPLDRLYAAVAQALDKLVEGVGLKAA